MSRDPTDTLLLACGVILLACAAAICFHVYDWRQEARDAGTPALRCDVEASDGDDKYDVYAIRRHSRSRIARGVSGAAPAMSAASLLCPLPSYVCGPCRESE